MQNLDLIFNYVEELSKKKTKSYKTDIYKGKLIKYKVESKYGLYDGIDLYAFLQFAKFLINCKHNNKKCSIYIEIDGFKDKIVYILLEMAIFILSCDANINIIFTKEPEENPINVGFLNSPICRTIIKNKKFNKDDFKKLYLESYNHIDQNMDIFFRKIYTRDNIDSDKEQTLASKVLTDANNILKNVCSEKDGKWSKAFSKVISELFCNASTHTKGDVIIDLHIVRATENSWNIDFAIVNISENMLYQAIEDKFNINDYTDKGNIYETLQKAYNIQSKNNEFSKLYTQEHFYTFCAFQEYVSTRDNIEDDNLAGTGLFETIKYILGNSEIDISYVMTGDKLIYIDKNLLKECNGIFTLNEENNINKRLSEKVIFESKVCFPGTIYNIHLIKELS